MVPTTQNNKKEHLCDVQEPQIVTSTVLRNTSTSAITQ
ncbi:MAG: hypothetical protein [Microvirus sp.]|nr:MAG: hypothetical protein [Microvirus sp.]